MLLNLLFLVLGLLLLTAGAEGLVRGGSRVALGLGLSPLFIGLTLVAYGTSSPELMVSALAALEERPEIAVGNVVGSNIFNIAVVLGTAALIAPLPSRLSIVRRELPIVIVMTIALLIFSLDAHLGRVEAVVFLAALLAYSGLSYRRARSEAEQAGTGQTEAASPPDEPPRAHAISAVLVLLGVAGLVMGARWFVHGAAGIARDLGISDAVIGLSLVATGTSLPELATSIVAAFRRELDIAVGNVLGSNIFNVLGILGITAAVHPVSVPDHMIRFDIPIALATAVLCLPIMLTGTRISRGEGALLLIGYAGYMIFLFVWGG